MTFECLGNDSDALASVPAATSAAAAGRKCSGCNDAEDHQGSPLARDLLATDALNVGVGEMLTGAMQTLAIDSIDLELEMLTAGSDDLYLIAPFESARQP